MLQTFFKVSPIAWVDLPTTSFDRYGECPVSEATIGSTVLSVRAVVYEAKRDGMQTYIARVNSSQVRSDFASAQEAKAYVSDLLQAYIASIIVPAEGVNAEIQ